MDTYRTASILFLLITVSCFFSGWSRHGLWLNAVRALYRPGQNYCSGIGIWINLSQCVRLRTFIQIVGKKKHLVHWLWGCEHISLELKRVATERDLGWEYNWHKGILSWKMERNWALLISFETLDQVVCAYNLLLNFSSTCGNKCPFTPNIVWGRFFFHLQRTKNLIEILAKEKLFLGGTYISKEVAKLNVTQKTRPSYTVRNTAVFPSGKEEGGSNTLMRIFFCIAMTLRTITMVLHIAPFFQINKQNGIGGTKN